MFYRFYRSPFLAWVKCAELELSALGNSSPAPSLLSIFLGSPTNQIQLTMRRVAIHTHAAFHIQSARVCAENAELREREN